jgi:hypothetical protein
MKTTNILYWVFTGLFGFFMISTSIGNVMSNAESIEFISGKLGYPEYMIPFLGVAKILGVIAILIPGFPRIKEWAYAGLFYDLSGATYSVLQSEGFQTGTLFMILPFTMMGLSYFFYHRKLKMKKEIKEGVGRKAVVA